MMATHFIKSYYKTFSKQRPFVSLSKTFNLLPPLGIIPIGNAYNNVTRAAFSTTTTSIGTTTFLCNNYSTTACCADTIQNDNKISSDCDCDYNSYYNHHQEPHKNKVIRHIAFPTLEERRRYLADVDFNVFHLTPEKQITFDMFSSGNAAMTQEQRSMELVGDEAYAGAKSFERLKKASRKAFGHTYCCPAHNGLGATKLLMATLASASGGEGTKHKRLLIPSNTMLPSDLPTNKKIETINVLKKSSSSDYPMDTFPGDIDLVALEKLLKDADIEIPYIQIQSYADGISPFSLPNLRAVRNLADAYGKTLVLDASRIVENAWYIKTYGTSGMSSRSLDKVVRDIAKCAHVIQVDASQDAKCPTGGLLATDNPDLYEQFMNQVVVYEGLHTYGGMSGRTMEAFAVGLNEMTFEDEVQWMMHQSQRFCDRLELAGVPLLRGCDGAYIQADLFLPHIHHHQQDTLSAALYEVSGVRICALGRLAPDHNYDQEEPSPLCLLPVQIPRLVMTNRQLDQVADAIINLYNDRDEIPPLEPISTKGPHPHSWQDQMRYRWIYSDLLHPCDFHAFPYVTHTIERTGTLDRERRRKAIEAAGYNTFLLKSSDVSIDLLTDSGTSAMSTDQWAAYNGARSTPATSDEYKAFVSTLQDITGYEHILPVHQGRAAEQILSEVMIQPGQIVPGNMYFTTTKLHQELAGGIFADIIVDEAHDPQSEFLWKGNIDMSKLESLVEQYGRDKIAYISFEHSVNMAGGQPVSMDNMREVYSYCSPLGIPVFFDSTRMAENAFMIQRRDPNYSTTKERDILREMMMYGDGCTVSGKKDFLINIGGVLAFRGGSDAGLEWKDKAEEKLRIYEGSVTNGGLSCADLAAATVGLKEMIDDRYICSRVLQTAELGRMLTEGGVPIVTPPGSHAIFLDAKRFLPHIDQDHFPAQRLAAEIYVETGVRAMERGTVSKGRDPKTGENLHPSLELVRLTIPRRVYSIDHIREVADGIIRLHKKRDEMEGLRIVYEPEKLRFFQGRFELL